jgi:hypothetical protein
MEDAETACQGMAKSIWFGKKWEKAKYVRMTFADRSICYWYYALRCTFKSFEGQRQRETKMLLQRIILADAAYSTCQYKKQCE